VCAIRTLALSVIIRSHRVRLFGPREFQPWTILGWQILATYAGQLV
jgi:hypothetical protein